MVRCIDLHCILRKDGHHFGNPSSIQETASFIWVIVRSCTLRSWLKPFLLLSKNVHMRVKTDIRKMVYCRQLLRNCPLPLILIHPMKIWRISMIEKSWDVHGFLKQIKESHHGTKAESTVLVDFCTTLDYIIVPHNFLMQLYDGSLMVCRNSPTYQGEDKTCYAGP